ncbi:MAG: hypothetical protein M1480_12980 [Bacteroidetes bacterium]|nr:hypothetical protein [Bacteroidota bacterium]
MRKQGKGWEKPGAKMEMYDRRRKKILIYYLEIFGSVNAWESMDALKIKTIRGLEFWNNA